MTFYYTLDDNLAPVPCDSIAEYEKWHDSMPSSSRWYLMKTGLGFSVARTDVGNRRISTVFLGIDHNYGGQGGPLLWETMVFPGATHCERYESYEEAISGHETTCKEVSNEKAD